MTMKVIWARPQPKDGCECVYGHCDYGLPEHWREEIVQAVHDAEAINGWTRATAVKRTAFAFHVSKQSVYRWLQREVNAPRRRREVR